MDTPEKQSQHRVFDLALKFLDTNSEADDSFLQVETFDPHEPFFTHSKYEDLYPHDYAGLLFDWPAYSRVTEPPKQAKECPRGSAAPEAIPRVVCPYWGTTI